MLFSTILTTVCSEIFWNVSLNINTMKYSLQFYIIMQLEVPCHAFFGAAIYLDYLRHAARKSELDRM
jgi:hypothetical protein